MSNYITEYLKDNNHIGASNGIKARKLLSALGRNSSDDSIRQLKAEIRRFRLTWCESEGIETFIFSDTEHGYYLTSNIEEVQHFEKAQRSRAIKAFETSKNIRQYLKRNQDELYKGV